MTLSAGTTLLHYRLTEKLGEGGMGVVWKAEDTTLDRSVAIKVLPESFATDPDRVARFSREAKLLAALNHPNIASIHSVHEVDGRHCIAMELVEGDELATLTARGPLPVDDALRIAVGIAAALEAAHDSGVVHRDLKPANVKIAPDGTVKVLDFGLAKAVEASTGSDGASPTWTPTVTSAGTRAGMILGTAAYMSPEQARGKPLDRRTDLWSFGCVLYECLTGVVLFRGETVSDSIAAILRNDPDWSKLPADTPAASRALLRRCLTRDPARRQQSAGDARVVLQEAIEHPEQTEDAQAPVPSRRHGWTAALLVAVGLLAGWGLSTLGKRTGDGVLPGEVRHLSIPLPHNLRIGQNPPRFGADGRYLVFAAVDVTPGVDHRRRLWVRDLRTDELYAVEQSLGLRTFAVSSDGKHVAFTTDPSGRSARAPLVRVPLDRSAPPQPVAEVEGLFSMRWLDDETIAGVSRSGVLTILHAAGGESREVALTGDPPPSFTRLWDALPDGHHVLFRAVSFESGAYQQYVGVVDTRTGESKKLVAAGSRPMFVAPGRLAFSRGALLYVVPFDAGRLEVTGPERVVLDGLWAEGAYTGGLYALSSRGDLAYLPGGVQGGNRTLQFVDRDGRLEPWSPIEASFNRVRSSPDGRWVAVQVDNIDEGDALLQIRVSEMDRPGFVTVGTRPGMDCSDLVWAADSSRLAYECFGDEAVEIYVTSPSSDASSRRIARWTTPNAGQNVLGFAGGDGPVLVARKLEDGGRELLAIDPDAEDPETSFVPVPVPDDKWEAGGLSADGRWWLYETIRGGRKELSVRAVDDRGSLGPRRTVGLETGEWWFLSRARPQGDYELIFDREGTIHAARLGLGDGVKVDSIRDLGLDPFDLRTEYLDVLADGRLLIIRSAESETGASEIRLVENWASDVARR